MPSFTILDKTDVLRFGKHQGKTVEWIMKNDPSWIIFVCKKAKIDEFFLFYQWHKEEVDALDHPSKT